MPANMFRVEASFREMKVWLIRSLLINIFLLIVMTIMSGIVVHGLLPKIVCITGFSAMTVTAIRYFHVAWRRPEPY